MNTQTLLFQATQKAHKEGQKALANSIGVLLKRHFKGGGMIQKVNSLLKGSIANSPSRNSEYETLDMSSVFGDQPPKKKVAVAAPDFKAMTDEAILKHFGSLNDLRAYAKAKLQVKLNGKTTTAVIAHFKQIIDVSATDSDEAK